MISPDLPDTHNITEHFCAGAGEVIQTDTLQAVMCYWGRGWLDDEIYIGLHGSWSSLAAGGASSLVELNE